MVSRHAPTLGFTFGFFTVACRVGTRHTGYLASDMRIHPDPQPWSLRDIVTEFQGEVRDSNGHGFVSKDASCRIYLISNITPASYQRITRLLQPTGKQAA